MKIKGKIFVKSSFSKSKCVGVSLEKDKVCVINTKEKTTTVEFTKDEWVAFIKGVKNCEFDISVLQLLL